MLTLVVIEDHDVFRELLVAQLEGRGHTVHAAADAEAVDDELAHVHPDAFVIDVGLPGEDGLSLARRLRASSTEVGIVIVSGHTSIEDRVAGYAAGADAYLTKPVAFDELDAVLHATARRHRQERPPDLRLELPSLELHGPAGWVRLTPGQASLLAALARAPDRQLETWQVIERLGRSPDTFRKPALEVALARLRERFEAVGAAREALHVVRGVGYRLTVSVQVVGVQNAWA